MIMPLKHLYIIGNGFDRYHGAESGYLDFRKYLYKRAPEVEACFDLYFGPKSLRRSFVHEEGWWDCYQTALLGRQDAYYRYPRTTWSWSNLWCDFEKYLSELNREKIFDVLDLRMPSVDEGERGFLEDETKGNWRLTTRYYIVQEAVERFESYYESNYKDASLIINQHNDFFESLGNIECVEVLGHSLSDVDMPYYDRIKLSLPSNVVWLFSCHSERDLSQIRRFCMRMNIKDTHYKIREW